MNDRPVTRKRVLIVNNNMHIGGVQQALASLLWNIRGRCDATLLLFAARGELLSELPPDVTVLETRSLYRCLGLTRRDARERPVDALARAALASVARTLGRSAAVRLCRIGQEHLSGFDVAISYLHNAAPKAFYGGCNDFVLNHVNAARKIAFLHCDYQAAGADHPANARQYACFDTIAACSQGCRDRFVAANPSLAERTVVAHNFHRFEAIARKADSAPVRLPEECVNIVTVARLGQEKGLDRALRAIRACRAENNTLRYWIVGDGMERDRLGTMIRELGLADVVSLCGAQVDPYGWMRAADLLLIPSRSEAAPLVIDEAASLGTPVLSTETCSAREQIGRRGLGWVCANSEAGLTDALRQLVADPALLKQKRAELQTMRFDNTLALAEFERLLEM